MSDETKADIEQQILQAADNSRRELRRVSTVAYSLVGVSLTAYLLLAFLSYMNFVPQDSVETLLLLTFASFSAPFLYSAFNSRQSRALKKLADYDDLSALGPLLTVRRHVTDPKTARAISAALTRLLLRVKVSDRTLLSDDEYSELLTLLSVCYNAITSPHFRFRNEAIYIAVLRATEQIGDAKALRIVEKIASVAPKSDSAQRIHRVSLECLSALRTRANSEGLGLLRPVVETQESNLLRSAKSSAHNPDHLELLRPGHVDEYDEVQIQRK